MEMSGNTVLITGGATGIGYAMAELFLAAGNEVIICGRREERLLAAQRVHPGLHVKVSNVAEEGDRRKLVEWVTAKFSNFSIDRMDLTSLSIKIKFSLSDGIKNKIVKNV